MRSSSPTGQTKTRQYKGTTKPQTSGSVTKNDKNHTERDEKREENKKGKEKTDDTGDQRGPHGWVQLNKEQHSAPSIDDYRSCTE